MKINNIFNNTLLRRDPEDLIPNQAALLALLVEIIADDKGEYEEYEVEEILDIKSRRKI
jgi:hypothetical protein